MLMQECIGQELHPDEKLFDLYMSLKKLPDVECKGLHIYDGHIRDENFEFESKKVEEAFAPVNKIVEKIILLVFRNHKLLQAEHPHLQFTRYIKKNIAAPERVCFGIMDMILY